ncbi:hypothetical protein BJY04DRAFT_113824 [Aspergillus karnatakaensis]|uniref:uncharacterized protein n=1 Tax=Aspergillus karnatakaensis TaxID=1810916 RepID=UPI003CCE48EC
MTNKAGLDSLYLVQLRQNTSQDIEFGIGYFGGCITTTETSSSSSDSNSNSTQTHCITNLRTKSAPDIAELYTENLPSQSLPQLTQFLNTTIPLIQDLQDSVFYYQLPVLHYALLILSSLILWVALMSSSQKRRYKFTLFLAAVFSAIALGLALLMGVGSLQAMNALEVLASESGSGINSGNDSSDDDNNLVLDIGNGITFHGAHRLANVQYAQAAVVGLFYILLGLMFVRRKEEGIRAVAFVPSMPRFRRR